MVARALRRRRWLWAAAREVGAGSGRRRDVDGGGARLARWGEQDGRRDEKPSVRRRAKEKGPVFPRSRLMLCLFLFLLTSLLKLAFIC